MKKMHEATGRSKAGGAASAAVVALAIAGAAPAIAQPKTTEEGIEQYREMLQDGNPADLNAMKGAGLWTQPRGPKNASLEKCDIGLGPGVVKGAYAQLPRYFADVDQVMDFESRLVHCMVTLQGFDREKLVAKPFSGGGQPATDIENIVAYVTDESRGEKVALPQDHPKEKEAALRGEKMFFYRAGPYDFSCASCHSNEGQRIRLQGLPNLTKPEPAQKAFTTWPAYRVSQGALRTMQWRIYDCFRQQRFPELKYLSPASIDLITYLGVKGKGGTMDAPAIKR